MAAACLSTFKTLFNAHTPPTPPLSFPGQMAVVQSSRSKKVSPGIYLAKKLFFGEWDWNQTLHRAGDDRTLRRNVEIL